MSFLAKGLTLKVDTNGLGSFSSITNITNCVPSGTQYETVDLTNHNDADKARKFATTLANPGTFQVDIKPLLPADAVHDLLYTLATSGANRNFRLTYPGNSLGEFQYSGFVSNWQPYTDIADIVGATFTVTITGAETDRPATIASVVLSPATPGPAFVTAQTISFIATFGEVVKVTGTPRISLVLDSGTVFANYAAGTNTNVLRFSKVIGGGDQGEATECSITSPIGLNSGTILDVGGNAATLTFTPPTLTTVSVNAA